MQQAGQGVGQGGQGRGQGQGALRRPGAWRSGEKSRRRHEVFHFAESSFDRTPPGLLLLQFSNRVVQIVDGSLRNVQLGGVV